MAGVPRISVAWLLVAAIVGVLAFFAYHIFTATGSSPVDPPQARAFDITAADVDPPVVPHNKPSPPALHITETVRPDVGFAGAELDAPVVVQHIPVVAGQTEEDLRATRPVMESPPSVEYADPTARDVSSEPSYFESEFGDNLRHPEQTMEIHPPMGTMRVPAAGLGSDAPPSLGANMGSTAYSPELAQNGGEFMAGIMAFDGSDGSGIGYSSI
jgi:hypothetical protein